MTILFLSTYLCGGREGGSAVTGSRVYVHNQYLIPPSDGLHLLSPRCVFVCLCAVYSVKSCGFYVLNRSDVREIFTSSSPHYAEQLEVSHTYVRDRENHHLCVF